MPLIVRTVIETRCRATHLQLGQVVILAERRAGWSLDSFWIEQHQADRARLEEHLSTPRECATLDGIFPGINVMQFSAVATGRDGHLLGSLGAS